MNAFIKLALTFLHTSLSHISGVPMEFITKIATALPPLVAAMDADSQAALLWVDKLKTVVSEAEGFLPPQYAAAAVSVVVVLTSIEVLVQKFHADAPKIEAEVQTVTAVVAPAPTGTTAQH